MPTGSASASEQEESQPGQPVLVFVDGTERRRFRLSKAPFSIGRRVDKDLVLNDSRCSRDHAVITREEDGYYVADGGSKLGTFVNGVAIERQKLAPQDKIEFGVRGGAYLIFDAEMTGAEAGLLLSRMSGRIPAASGNELATLNVLLEAARELNRSTVLEEVLVTLLDTSLRLTRAERGFVFLREADGSYRMAAGRSARGDTLMDDATISRSTLQEAADGGCEFVVTEEEDSDKLVGRMSVANYGIASVICIPLRKTSMLDGRGPAAKAVKKTERGEVLGVMYLDSRSLAGRLTGVTHDVLRTIATDAAKLVENARLVQGQEAARRYEQEMAIAAKIQQRLLSVRIPDVPYAEVRARSVACQQVGGDFFDVVRTGDAIAVAVGDVSGKGVSAALLASVLQGLIYSQLGKGAPLAEIAEVVHRFLCEKEIGEKYATLLLARAGRSGELEFVNCGHVPPALVRGGVVEVPEESNPPVGLVREVTFSASKRQMRPGDRLLAVTDGVTEAENAAGEYFGLETFYAMAATKGLAEIVDAVTEFSAGVAPSDDCTGLELVFKGE